MQMGVYALIVLCCFVIQPIHLAVRAEQLEMVSFLISKGADVNARTNWGEGPTPLNIARSQFDSDHKLCHILEKVGAQDIAGDWGDDEDYDDEDDGDEDGQDESEEDEL